MSADGEEIIVLSPESVPVGFDLLDRSLGESKCISIRCSSPENTTEIVHHILINRRHDRLMAVHIPIPVDGFATNQELLDFMVKRVNADPADDGLGAKYRTNDSLGPMMNLGNILSDITANDVGVIVFSGIENIGKQGLAPDDFFSCIQSVRETSRIRHDKTSLVMVGTKDPNELITSKMENQYSAADVCFNVVTPEVVIS